MTVSGFCQENSADGSTVTGFQERDLLDGAHKWRKFNGLYARELFMRQLYSRQTGQVPDENRGDDCAQGKAYTGIVPEFSRWSGANAGE